jgi:succinate dehydrogenase / fumarate reductase membrane anchor subunit
MILRTPLGKVRGLGSARHGVDTWWQERLSALALIPLGLWFIGSLLSQVGADHAAFKDWIGTPGRAVAMILFLFCTFFHMKLSMTVIIEDYVHTASTAFVLRLVVTFLTILLGTASIFSVLKLALGG